MPQSDLTRSRLRSAWLFLLPMLVVLLLVAGWPLVRTIWLGFTDANLADLSQSEFIGFDNYYNSVDGKSYGVLVDPDWWNAVWNTRPLRRRLGRARDRARPGRRAGAQRRVPGPRPRARRDADPLGHPDHRLGQDVGLDAATTSSASSTTCCMRLGLHRASRSPGPPIADTAHDGRADRRRLEDHAVHGAADPGRPADAAQATCYEAAEIDGIHPVKVFFRVTLPLIRPALMVAVIFRLLDALRIFDLIYVLTPNSEATMTMSVLRARATWSTSTSSPTARRRRRCCS